MPLSFVSKQPRRKDLFTLKPLLLQDKDEEEGAVVLVFVLPAPDNVKVAPSEAQFRWKTEKRRKNIFFDNVLKREREKERERECVFVRESEREREKERERENERK